MTQLHIRSSIENDDIAEAMVEDLHSSSDLVAQFAAHIQPGTMGFDDFMDTVRTLSGDEKRNIYAMAKGIADSLEDQV